MKGREMAPGSMMNIMRQRIMPLCVLPFITSVMSLPCRGQDIEPRRWSHLPIGGNFAGAGYAYTTGEVYFDPALRLEDVQFDLQTVAVKYIHCHPIGIGKKRLEVFRKPATRQGYEKPKTSNRIKTHDCPSVLQLYSQPPGAPGSSRNRS